MRDAQIDIKNIKRNRNKLHWVGGSSLESGGSLPTLGGGGCVKISLVTYHIDH